MERRATKAFTTPPAIRASQSATAGVSATDGVTVIDPAINQYETCFRCHGTSAGKGSATVNHGYFPARLVSSEDPLNTLSQFSATATSSHPVTRDRSSPFPQPKTDRTRRPRDISEKIGSNNPEFLEWHFSASRLATRLFYNQRRHFTR